MESLTIHEEEEELEVQLSGDGTKAVETKYCLVERFITDRLIHVHIMKERMAEV